MCISIKRLFGVVYSWQIDMCIDIFIMCLRFQWYFSTKWIRLAYLTHKIRAVRCTIPLFTQPFFLPVFQVWLPCAHHHNNIIFVDIIISICVLFILVRSSNVHIPYKHIINIHTYIFTAGRIIPPWLLGRDPPPPLDESPAKRSLNFWTEKSSL